MMYLCFDLGGTAIKAGVVDAEGSILVKGVESTKVSGGLEAVFQQLMAMGERLSAKEALERRAIAGVGIGVPGFVEGRGFVSKVPNLGWENIDLKAILERRWGLPVFVLNDANAAALGEMWQGAGRDCANLLCLTVGTGIGAGVVINGELHTGAKGLAGEIGHLQVRTTGGRQCNCGKTGCLETESSGSALVYYGEQAVNEKRLTRLEQIMARKGQLSAKDIVKAAEEGDAVAKEVIDRAASYLGLTLANVYLILAPQKIIIGGGVAGAGATLFDPVVKWFNRFALPGVAGEEILVLAQLGNDAGMVGLACLVKRNLGLQ